MNPIHDFEQIARLPAPGDNVAIATRRLEAGTRFTFEGRELRLDYTVLEGHRFAVRPIAAGEALLSWGLPFGFATRPIGPGNYVCNPSMLEALAGRRIDFALPGEPNFHDAIEPYALDEARFRPGVQMASYPEPRTFMGYPRGPARGVGTRNFIIVLGTTSQTGSYARRLAEKMKGLAADYENVSGVVAVAHTEGAGGDPLNNRELVLRTLAGFMVHPNVGAVLAVDYGMEAITNALLGGFAEEHSYPLDKVTHRFLTLTGRFQADLEMGAAILRDWLPEVNRAARTPEMLSHLKIALQCGGSDAFSGVSGNPLAASVAKEVIRHGGSANLAETDELVGAEAYMLQNVRDLETARAFLDQIERFKERLAWHGVTAEGNPSGGNRFRGLYNIALKSIGAAMKRHPDVRVDHVIDYAEPMAQPGLSFMNSPGNDLESIAGQVASGCNLIFFVTGNGSITNFPFVPTIKFITTTGRYRLLRHEMDVNAGAYLDGVPMDELTREALDLTVSIASGTLSQGEKAGHSQVSIWRNWRQTDSGQVARLLDMPEPTGQPIPIDTDERLEGDFQFVALRSGEATVADQIGLILPTSLCAGQVARMSAARLNQRGLGRDRGLSRFAALVHTEGCGFAGHSTQVLYPRTLLNYMAHPLVKYGLFLEHGCEKTHNDYMRQRLEALGRDPERFGWASIQLDGGIESVLRKIEAWFESASGSALEPATQRVGLDGLRLGLLAVGPIPEGVARNLARLTRTIAGARGTVVVPQSGSLLNSEEYLQGTLKRQASSASLAYGQLATARGLHIMESPSNHWVETLTGLGATGVEVMLAYVGGPPVQVHPMIPLIQVAGGNGSAAGLSDDFDLVLPAAAAAGSRLTGEPDGWAEAMLRAILKVASRESRPKLWSEGNADFQLTRGLLGVST